MSKRLISIVWLALAVSIACGAFAQTATTTTPKPPATTAAPAATPPAAPTAAKVFKEDELASLLAPIALYPDAVVTQILIASTYPIEVIEAYRWVQQNPNLKGEALATAAKQQPWDPSVQALTGLPEVLKMMDEKLDWMQKLGDAFLAQQKDVMAMVQTLRAKAKEAGNLKSDDHMKVTTEAAPATTGAAAAPASQVIVIESADPQVVYVPTYSPVTVYGSWGYPAYPPYYWPPPYGYPGTGFWWGVGVGVSIGFWGGCWDNHADWHGGDINIGEINIDRGDRGEPKGDRGDRGANAKSTDRGGANAKATDRGGAGAKTADKGGQKWSHNPEHRKGVSYRDNATASKYDRGSTGSAASRDAYRGRTSTGTGAGASAGTSDWRGGGSSGASAGTRDLGSSSGSRGTSASAGTRDMGSSSGSRGTSASAGTRDMGSSSRASSSSYGGGSRGSSSSAFGGMSSGSRASSYGSRGGASRGGGGGRRR